MSESESEALEALDPAAVKDALRSAFGGLSTGAAVQPAQTVTEFSDGRGDCTFHPGLLHDLDLVGVKMSPYIVARSEHGLSPVTAYTLLLSASPGEPVLLVDPLALTTARTAATTSLAVDLLAAPGAGKLAVIGAGSVAIEHIRYVSADRSWSEVAVFSPSVNDSTSEASAARREALAIVAPHASIAASSALAVVGADVILLCTSSGQPVIDMGDVADGAPVTSISTNPANAHEIDPAALSTVDVYCDYRATSPVTAGEMILAAEQGWNARDIKADLAERTDRRIWSGHDPNAVLWFHRTRHRRPHDREPPARSDNTAAIDALRSVLATRPWAPLALLPTPVHRLDNFRRALGGPELWIKRDDLTGLVGGGNKTRKLEYLVGDALASGADMLVTVGAIQSNHTRQTAAAAARHNMKCALLHFGWTEDAGPLYRQTGNILLSSLMGADLYLDETPRPIEDQSPLVDFVEQLRRDGHKPYLIPGGASEHALGSFGYMGCAAEILRQADDSGVRFDHIVHCTGSSSTQAGLLAGFAHIGQRTSIIGVADDHETDTKCARVLELANDALVELDSTARVTKADVEIIAADQSEYGEAEPQTFDLIRQLASTEGIVADPVYEGKALRGLHQLIKEDRFDTDARVLLMHLGGTPAVHAYANQFGTPAFKRPVL